MSKVHNDLKFHKDFSRNFFVNDEKLCEVKEAENKQTDVEAI